MITPIMSTLLLVQEAMDIPIRVLYSPWHDTAGPDTRIDGWDSCSGYYYEDTTINGFAHTRLSGAKIVRISEISC